MGAMKKGRPKSKEPTRDKNVTFRLTADELKKVQDVCTKYDVRYVDIFLKGADSWSKDK